MPGYRRFAAYVYEYRKGKKGMNCGFIKVEVKDGRCMLDVRLRCEGIPPGSTCKVYGFVRRDGLENGIFLGSLKTEEGRVEGSLEADANSLGGSGISMEKLGGMILLTEAGGFYGTEWDDQPIRPANFQEMAIKSQVLDKEQENKDRKYEEPDVKGPKEKAVPEKSQEKKKAQEEKKETQEEKKEAQEEKKEAQEEKKEAQEEKKEAQEEKKETQKIDLEEKTKEGIGQLEKVQEDGEQKERELKEKTKEQIKEKDLQEIEEKEADIGEVEEKKEEQERKQEAADTQTREVVETQSMEEGAKKPQPEQENPEGPLETGGQNKAGNSLNQQIKDPQLSAGQRPLGEACIPFPDRDFPWCKKMQPRDLPQIFPRQWGLQNNRFLQYGSHNFGHILLCRCTKGQYLLGVPGVYDQQEGFMARMFGFPYFKESPLIQAPKARGGYWYRLIDPPDCH